MLLVCLFVCYQNYAKKATQPIFKKKIGGKVAHGPRKKTVRFRW